MFPNVYVPKQAQPSLEQRIAAAWLWSHREATIAGTAAATLHGAKWIDADICMRQVHRNPRPPPGVRTRRDVLLGGETKILGEITVTTSERTAFDIGRRQLRRTAVALLDALMRATGFKVHDVLAVAERHRGARGLRRLETTLKLVNPGAQSPGKAICAYCSSTPAFRNRKRRSRCWASTAVHSPTSTWAGRT